MAKLREEYNNFLADVEKNLKNKEDVIYVKQRFSIFVDKLIDQIDEVFEAKQQRIDAIEEKQNRIENKMNVMQQAINNIEKDIYSEEDFDFEIICPYCDNQFVIEAEEGKTEVECPQCNNIIELDWSEEGEENLEKDYNLKEDNKKHKEKEDNDDDM